MDLAYIVCGKPRYILRSLGVGWHEQPRLKLADHLKRAQIGGHVIYERDPVLIQRRLSRKAVREVHDVVRGAEPNHIEEVPGKRDDRESIGKRILAKRLGVAF